MPSFRVFTRWLPLVLVISLTACSQDRMVLVDPAFLGSLFTPAPGPKVISEDDPEPGAEQDSNVLKMKLVWCPAGEFIMGSPESDPAADAREKPQVAVTLSSGFWLGKCEVTQGDFERIMRTAPWRGPMFFSTIKYVKRDSECAASYITWDDAMAFCRKLTELEHKAGRLPAGWEYTLPSEAQWEYACRAGTRTIHSFGDDDDVLGDYARFGGLVGHGNTRLNPYASYCGQKQANPWGLHDMYGNVFEWCRDVMVDALPGGTDPVVTSGSENRVCRGGSWDMTASRCRSAYRGWYPASFSDFSTGFRVALCRVQNP
ncbi:MAG: formylglycine-generating enzyme family protein [Planctomycetes bacterium]|nr:formylglycine-generating enzyme family protein [Planctomycetota bacterium]